MRHVSTDSTTGKKERGHAIRQEDRGKMDEGTTWVKPPHATAVGAAPSHSALWELDSTRWEVVSIRCELAAAGAPGLTTMPSRWRVPSAVTSAAVGRILTACISD
eukprot:CAMPEP_0174736620 /NCGR_PEP_ID=MMETSP1094-20130205/66985_1 /TAXON_ID=156173 /ORGANISM="Chrysochromulina brevifilum, Strain UTEX LB 985" /LENGTH=104 /DNA_ID=CAMNT_0015939753 /DNA_START=155 /DNA_END=470 /DNA_ORIENTATION=-